MTLFHSLLPKLSTSPPLRRECSPRFYPLFSALLHLYLPLKKLFYTDDSQVIFPVQIAPLSFKLQQPIGHIHLVFSEMFGHATIHIQTPRKQEAIFSFFPLTSHDLSVHQILLVLSSIYPFLSIFTTKDLVSAFVVTHLIFCNIFLTDHPASGLVPLKKQPPC